MCFQNNDERDGVHWYVIPNFLEFVTETVTKTAISPFNHPLMKILSFGNLTEYFLFLYKYRVIILIYFLK